MNQTFCTYSNLFLIVKRKKKKKRGTNVQTASDQMRQGIGVNVDTLSDSLRDDARPITRGFLKGPELFKWVKKTKN